MSKIIGIDFGTTNSVMSILEGRNPTIIPNKMGARLTPSVVSFSKKNDLLIGQVAKNQAVINSERTISSIKRSMGKDKEIKIGRKKYTPPEIAAMIIRKLKEDAEDYLGEELERAVITVPAYFSDSQRQATKDAGKMAGLEVLRIINEPTAACLAFGINQKEDKMVMVFDFGGGTYDVSILEISDGVFEVKATSGNNYLGGDDIDQKLIDYIAKEFLKQENIDLREDRLALQKLKEEAEKAKISLSEIEEVNINIPFITADEHGPKHIDMIITRKLFEDLIKDIINQLIEPANAAINDAELSIDDIDKILLVGGSTRIPLVQEAIKNLTNNSLDKSINPDECVAIGAAIQGGIINGDLKGILLVDVTPLSLGIETEGKVFVPIIDRNTIIPTTGSKIFSTISDNQTTVEVHVLQGESPNIADNITLGRFQLTGIKPAPKGTPCIEVTFDIDVDGIVHVKALDMDTGKKQSILISDFIKLSEEDIQRHLAGVEERRQEKVIHG